jgi:predicted ArsR family transcriptional regulator
VTLCQRAIARISAHPPMEERPRRPYAHRVPEPELLAYVEEEPSSTTREIAEHFGMRPAAALERLRNLRAAGKVVSQQIRHGGTPRTVVWRRA